MERTQRMVSKLMEVDPEFVQLCDTLYGPNVDPKVVWEDVFSKISPDQADVHVNDAERKKRTMARVGLASNIVGLTAGTLGLKSALSDERLGGKHAPKATQKIFKPLQKLPQPLSSRKGKIGAALAGGALATQAANIGGDVVVNRIVAAQAKKQGKPVTTAKRSTGRLVLVSKLDPATVAAGAAKAAGHVPAAAKRVRGRRVAGTVVPTGNRSRGVPRPKKAKTPAPVPEPEPVATTPKAPEKPGKPAWQRPVPIMAGVTGGTVAAGLLARQHLRMKEAQRAQAAQAYDPYAQTQEWGKRDDGMDVEWIGEFSKLDEDKHLAFGWASVLNVNGVPVVDKQGDYIHPDDLEDAAYRYVLKSGTGGDMHRRDGEAPYQAASLVESMVVTPEKIEKMGLPKDMPVGWWVGFKVHDPDTWADVKKGLRTGFSIHGRGKRSSMDYDAVMGWS